MKIYFSRKAEKYLRSIPPRISLNILGKIKQIPKGDIKPLSDRRGEYRLRMGKCRVLFFLKKDLIQVYKVDTRGDIHK